MESYHLTPDINSQGIHILVCRNIQHNYTEICNYSTTRNFFFLGAGLVWEEYSGQLTGKKFLWEVVVITKG